MILQFDRIRHMPVTEKCPSCGRETGTDMGHVTAPSCPGTFEIEVDWGEVIKQYINGVK